MSANPQKNEYMKNYESITQIQEHILKCTDSYNQTLKSIDAPNGRKNYIQIIDNINIIHSITNVA